MNHARRLFACSGLLISACVNGQIHVPAGSPGTTTTGSGGSDATPGIGGGSGGATGPGDSDASVGPGGAGGDIGTDGGEGDVSMGGNGGAPAQDAGPAPPIDFSMWQLQLPTGSGTSPTIVLPDQLAGFSNLYFYKADDGGQIFMDPATGVTTSGSVHPRTELREMSMTGTAAWSSEAINTMSVTGKVLKGSSVTIAQVFNGPESITLAELQYSSNGFTLFYEEAKGQGNSTKLGNAVPLNTQYTFTIGLSKNVLSLSINGKPVYSHTPSSHTLGSKFYFKVGNYDQTASPGAVGTTAHSLVEVYKVAVVHQ